MAFSPAFLEELRRRLSIFDLVGRKVRLTRRGNQATGLCPFHNEKSPSFHVYDDDEPHYHCFGCGVHGDVITFVMQTEGLEFRDTVERLAGEAGLEVPKDTPQERERAERQASLGTVMEASCVFFEKQLGGSAGAGLSAAPRPVGGSRAPVPAGFFAGQPHRAEGASGVAEDPGTAGDRGRHADPAGRRRAEL